jgi:hypothetical protein
VLGVRLGRFCIARDIPIAHVADYFGVTRQTAYNWFFGVHVPSKRCSLAIAEFLDKAM